MKESLINLSEREVAVHLEDLTKDIALVYTKIGRLQRRTFQHDNEGWMKARRALVELESAVANLVFDHVWSGNQGDQYGDNYERTTNVERS